MPPLYKRSVEPKWSKSSHTGLWYDKFCNTWNAEWENGRNKEKGSNKEYGLDKSKWINTIAGKKVGDEKALAESTERLLRIVSAQNGVLFVLTSESRFVTGLGRNHPVENGFVWHPTLGVPYLPGSSLKGMLHAWASWEAKYECSSIDLDTIFGSQKAIGQLIIFDLLPMEPVKLEADVMTPHYAAWSPDEPPGDWRSPVPIPFLVVTEGIKLLCGMALNGGENKYLLDKVQTWLVDAIKWAGAGAKTSAGYGRFYLDEKETSALQERIKIMQAKDIENTRRAQAMKTPQGRWQEQINSKKERDILDIVRVHLEKTPLADAKERQGLAYAVSQTGLPDLWIKGNKREKDTQVGSAKLKERARLIFKELGGDNM